MTDSEPAVDFDSLLAIASEYGNQWSRQERRGTGKLSQEQPTKAPDEAKSGVIPGGAPGHAEKGDSKSDQPVKTGRARIKAGNLNPERIQQSKARKAQSRTAHRDAPISSVSINMTCPSCQGEMRMREFEMECTSCKLVVEGDTTVVDSSGESREHKHHTARLRIVGTNSALFQPDLDRSSISDGAAASHRQILDELNRRRDRHKERGKRQFSQTVIVRAAELYAQVQSLACKRSNNKSTILAACLRHACIEVENLVLKKSEIADFMDLKVGGIARGDNFIRMLAADKHIDISVNQEMIRPNIVTTFTCLGLEDSTYDKLRDVVEKLVQRAIDRHIGSSSIITSKVVGTTYIVLRRYMFAGNKLPPHQSLSTQKICDTCGIRRSTLDRFLKEINIDHHSQFEDIYKEFGLAHGRFEELEAKEREGKKRLVPAAAPRRTKPRT